MFQTPIAMRASQICTDKMTLFFSVGWASSLSRLQKWNDPDRHFLNSNKNISNRDRFFVFNFLYIE
jgi:hypothetical protein